MACDANINNRLTEKKPNLSVCYGDAYGETQENIIKNYIMLDTALYEKLLNSKALQKEISSKIKELQQKEMDEVEALRKSLLNDIKNIFFIKYKEIKVEVHTEGIDIYYKKSYNPDKSEQKQERVSINKKTLDDLKIEKYKDFKDLNTQLRNKISEQNLSSSQVNNLTKIIELIDLYISK